MRISAGQEDWHDAVWTSERQFPTRFSKPEIQISLSNSFNQTVNALSIAFAPEEVRAIEVQAEPVREKVKKLYEQYRPGQNNGDADTGSSVSLAVQEKFANYRPEANKGENGLG